MLTPSDLLACALHRCRRGTKGYWTAVYSEKEYTEVSLGGYDAYMSRTYAYTRPKSGIVPATAIIEHQTVLVGGGGSSGSYDCGTGPTDACCRDCGGSGGGSGRVDCNPPAGTSGCHDAGLPCKGCPSSAPSAYAVLVSTNIPHVPCGAAFKTVIQYEIIESARPGGGANNATESCSFKATGDVTWSKSCLLKATITKQTKHGIEKSTQETAERIAEYFCSEPTLDGVVLRPDGVDKGCALLAEAEEAAVAAADTAVEVAAAEADAVVADEASGDGKPLSPALPIKQSHSGVTIAITLLMLVGAGVAFLYRREYCRKGKLRTYDITVQQGNDEDGDEETLVE